MRLLHVTAVATPDLLVPAPEKLGQADLECGASLGYKPTLFFITQ